MHRKEAKNHIVETLEKVGLGENEAFLYSIMLRYPKSTVQELQTRTPFPRTMLYYVLSRLEQAGLVSALKEKWRTLYVVENPERLYDVLAEREREFAQRTEAVRELIPELKNKYRLASGRPSVRLLEGIEGYQKALEDSIVSKPEIIYAYGDLSGKKPGREMREAYEHQRRAKRIQKKVLLFDSDEARQSIKAIGYDDYTQFRFIKERVEAFAVDLELYSGKLLYTTYADREPMAMLIEDERLFRMQLNLFNSLWVEGEDATLLSMNK